MNLETVKRNLSDVIENSKALLSVDGYLGPVILSIAGENVIPISVDMSTLEKKDEVASQLRSLAKDSDYLVLIMDARMKEFSDREMDSLPDTLKGAKGVSEAIVTFLYTRDRTFMRKVVYLKKDDDSYCFFDVGWEKVKEKSEATARFHNPFLNP